MTIKTAYLRLYKTLSASFEAREAANITGILMEDAFDWNKVPADSSLSPRQLAELEAFTQRLLLEEPIQYVLGMADFYGLKFKVNEQVLIPRPETEELVFWIASFLKQLPVDKKYSLLDIGTGSGCIPISLKHIVGNLIQAQGIDISSKAIEIAQFNAEQLNVELDFYEMDILQEANWSKFNKYDFIVSNPPYIPVKEMNLVGNSVRSYEPELALYVPDEDPLLFYRKISEFASTSLQKFGFLFFEINEFRAKQVAEIMQQKGFSEIQIEKDLQGKDRMIMGRWI